MKFKDNKSQSRFELMAKRAQELAIEMDEWSQKKYGIELTITATVSTFEEDRALGRESDTHRTGRAFDIRIFDLPEGLVAELCAYFRRKYPKLGAAVAGNYNLIVYKPHGSGPHLHVQIKRAYAVVISKDQLNGKEEESTGERG